MTSKLSLSSAVSSATSLVAISSISAATVAADDKPNHHAAAVVAAAVATDDPLKDVSVEQDDITSAIDITALEERLFTPKSSTAAVKPDVGILSKDFLKNKGKEKQPADRQFAIHRKKQAAAGDVDVGILGNGRRQKTFDTNLHAKNEVAGRSLQSDEEIPLMCPGKNGIPGLFYFSILFNVTDSPGWEYIENLLNLTDAPFFSEDGFFPKCSCPSPTTCGPNLCECLELNADGDILQCMDSFNQLCQGTKYIEGIPGPWSFEECLGDSDKSRAIHYCSYLPCFVDGGSWLQCRCGYWDARCTEFRHAWSCARSKCCQAQTDDEGREECIFGGLHENYYDQVPPFSISEEEMISRFNECSFNSDSGKSVVQCYCESFSYGRCVNYGVGNPDICEAMNCCFGETEDDAKLDCFTTRFRTLGTGFYFYKSRNEIQESCVASGKSSNQCKCDIQGLSNCVHGIDIYNWEPRCDLFQCCQSKTSDNDEGRNDCLVQDEAQLMYGRCIIYGRSTESCICDKSNALCSSGPSNDLHCELSRCCQEQADDTGRKECIDNFTTSQPSSAPSETTPTEDSIDKAEASPTAAIALPGASSASTPTPFCSKSLSEATTKTLAAAIICWVLLT